MITSFFNLHSTYCHTNTFQRSSSMKIWPVSSYMLFFNKALKLWESEAILSLLTWHVRSIYAVVNLNINARDIQETVMVNGQSCSVCSQVQTCNLWANSSLSQEIRKKGNCPFFLIYFPCSRVNTHWLWDLKLFIFVLLSGYQTVTRKVNKDCHENVALLFPIRVCQMFFICI